MSTMRKAERIGAAIAGAPVDRPPVALWRHFPGDDQRPDTLAQATLAFQRAYDYDLIKVSPASSFCLRDWGARDEWVGTLEGTRDYTYHPIHGPEDWLRLRALDPRQGALGAQLECLRQICAGSEGEAPVIQTIFSPLAQAKNLVGPTLLPVHLRRYGSACHAALAAIAETTMRFIEAARETGIAGVFYAVQQAQYGLLSEAEFAEFGRRYDLQVLAETDRLWLNMLHVHGSDIMFDQVADYPAQVMNWHDQETRPSLAEAQERFQGAICGGLDRWRDLVRGTPEQIRVRVREAFVETSGQRFVLGTGCVTPIVAPTSNLRAVREAVETIV